MNACTGKIKSIPYGTMENAIFSRLTMRHPKEMDKFILNSALISKSFEMDYVVCYDLLDRDSYFSDFQTYWNCLCMVFGVYDSHVRYIPYENWGFVVDYILEQCQYMFPLENFSSYKELSKLIQQKYS